MKNKLFRRDFLKFGCASLAGFSTYNCTSKKKNNLNRLADSGKSVEWRNRQPEMTYRRLGRTGYMVSEIVMGGGPIAPDNYKHVELAIDMGLNYLDTAPAYGNTISEQGYALVINGSSKREKVFLNTKVSIFDINRNELYNKIFESLSESEQKKIKKSVQELIERRRITEQTYIGSYFDGQLEEIHDAYLSNVMEKKYGNKIDRRKEYYNIILKSVEESLSRLGTDYLDLLMCPHGTNSPEELKIHEIFEAFEKLKKDGKVRYFGLSSHSDPAGILFTAINSGKYDAAMVAYNITNGAYLESILCKAYENDFGIIAMKAASPVTPREGRKQPPESRVKKLNQVIPGEMKIPMKAYLWALQNPNISSVISLMPDAAHVKDNLPLAGKKIKLIPLE